MQGEADACEADPMQHYAERYHNMLSDFSAAFAEYVDGCVFVDAGISEIWPFYRDMNAFKAAYAATHDNCVFMDTIAHGLTTQNEPEDAVDIYHYDSDSVIQLGRMFGEALKSALSV